MAVKVQLSPEELKSQSAEMSALQGEFDALFSSINSELRSVNSNWSENLANNFVGKITSAQAGLAKVVELLGTGAAAAGSSAESFLNVDGELSKLMSTDHTSNDKSGAPDIKANSTNMSTIWNDIKDRWNETGDAYAWARENYNKLPEDLRKKVEEIVGKDEVLAAKIVGDLLTGDVTWKTLEKGLKAVGTDKTETAVIVKSFSVTVDQIFDEGSPMRTLLEGQALYEQNARDAFANGRIADGFKDLGMEVACVASLLTYGSLEVLSEITADMIAAKGNAVYGTISNIGKIVPGTGGEVVSTIGSGIASATNAVTSWIRGWL